jgi:hypothetical protein
MTHWPSNVPLQPRRLRITPAAVGCNDGMDSSRFLRGIIAVNRGSEPHQEEADMDATTVAVDLAKDVLKWPWQITRIGS